MATPLRTFSYVHLLQSPKTSALTEMAAATGEVKRYWGVEAIISMKTGSVEGMSG